MDGLDFAALGNWAIAVTTAVGGLLGATATHFFQKRRDQNKLDQLVEEKAEALEELAEERQHQRDLVDRLRQYVQAGLLKPIQLPTGHRRNSVMVIGLGGVGKTTLIKKLTLNPAIDPTRRTEKYDLYTFNMAVMNGAMLPSKEAASPAISTTPDSETTHVFITDYKGQDIGQLVRSFVEQQKALFSPMAYGHVTTLLLVVDVVGPKKGEDDEDPEPRREPDKERIRDQVRLWSELMLDAVFGFLTRESLQYVCLFINKVDLIDNVKGRQELLSHFQPVVELLRQRTEPSGVKVKTIIGSAQDGTGIDELRSGIMENAVAVETSPPPPSQIVRDDGSSSLEQAW